MLLGVGVGRAADPAAPPANPLDAVPDKMPFNTPYGAPISLQRAQAVAAAAMAEAAKRGWQLNIAVVDSGANLVTFVRMDGAQLGSIASLGTQGAHRGEVPPADQGVRRHDSESGF